MIGVVMAADGAGLAGGMLTSEAAGTGGVDASNVATAPADAVAVAVEIEEVLAATGAVGASVLVGEGEAGAAVRVGRGLLEPVGTGVAAGGVAPTPVTAGVGESAPGVGIGDEAGGVDVTPASRGTENA